MSIKIAMVGATGAVGRQMFQILSERKFSFSDMIPFASERSEGKSISYEGRTFKCQVLKKGCFKGVDLVFFDASDAISKEWVPEAVEAGAWVVDSSATYRMTNDVPLVVPEVNGHLVREKVKNKAK